MKSILFFFSTLIWTVSSLAQTGSITGIISDADTKETLIGVNVKIQGTEKGAATDANGKYYINTLTPGVYALEISYIGYQTKSVTDIVVGANRVVVRDVQLSPSAFQSEELVVTSSYYESATSANVSTVSFNPEELRRSPGSAQEFARVLMALPSVSQSRESSQDMLVRGGSPMENAFYVDNIPVPAVQHFRDQGGASQGPIGIVNSDLIADLDFYAGAFSVAYGDRLSSVSDVTYREGNKNRTSGSAGLNMAGFTFDSDGSFANDKATWMISARRSFLDLIAAAINAGGAPRYQDAQIKLTYELNKNQKLSFLNINGSSNFTQSIDDAIETKLDRAARADYAQNTAGLNLRSLWNNGYSNTSISHSYFSETGRDRDVVSRSDVARREVDQNSVTMRNVNHWTANDRLKFDFGAEATLEWNDFGVFQAQETISTGDVRPEINSSSDLQGSLAAGFASATFSVVPSLSVTTGFRGDWNSFNEEFYVSPRANLNWQIAPKLGFNAGWGMFRQTLPRFLMAQNPGAEELPSMLSTHIIAGLSYFITEDTKISVEYFDKQYSDVPRVAANSDLFVPIYVPDNGAFLYQDLETGGQGWARGVELLVQKKLAQNLYGMVSASYFRTRYEDARGNWHNREFDTQYLFSVIGGYRPSAKWEFSARWSLQGARPITPIDVAASQQAGTTVLDMTQFLDDRLTPFHSLYARADRRFFFEKTNLVAYVELWNAYNQRNIDFQYWNSYDNRIEEQEQFSLLPVVGMRFEF